MSDDDGDFSFIDESFDAWLESGQADEIDPDNVIERLPTKWKQKNGVIVNIVDLDDRHLDNIIYLLRSRLRTKGKMFKAMMQEKKRRENDEQ